MKTNYCGKLNINDLESEVELFGWIANKRKFKNQTFVDLRDSSGIVQLVFNSISDPLLTKESCLQIKGKVVKRLEANAELPSGEIEVLVDSYKILNSSKQIPFDINDNKENSANEDLRLEYRFLDIRNERILQNLKLRHKLSLYIRNFFDKNNFIEFETPILAKSTPEGARDYLVPTRKKGKFFALPQSPQLFKQLLMAGGVEKYFQIARVFRDEDLRKDRQPEFTQLDIELSFSNQEEIFSICENMWTEVLGKLGYQIESKFPRMDFGYAMKYYGTDKPDTRFEFLINDYSAQFKDKFGMEFVKAIIFDQDVTLHLKKIEEIFYKNSGEFFEVLDLSCATCHVGTALANEFEAGPQKKLYALIGAGNDEQVTLKALGAIRTLLNEIYQLADPKKLNFLWIINWPMFEFDKDENKYVSAHHPFTQFEEDTLKYLETNEYEKIKAKSYDLVLNGFELGSGSIRIHDLKTQELMFDILKISKKEQQERFGFFLKAFSYGLPPHCGIAFGLERVLMILTNSASIRDVIAFPKNAKGSDLLTLAPSEVTTEQLLEYNLEIKK
ncbi:Aspartyl-tRNA synthetase (Aspartate-tRNA ligase) [Metamycoplasma auris 15026]|uniref:Aspartate--tRNA ligase n=1 Tax=Metamycoplasma auris 15026 TaxID=1188233 RepID=N9VAI4_9BACT|nr:aspartate--tRNA ligase [Metamycoplasma auris]ENY68678.1 Aspartyl-tRNA synthetase (Aspartate-tRNA ligase) [Metamycoplasma auris 15026]